MRTEATTEITEKRLDFTQFRPPAGWKKQIFRSGGKDFSVLLADHGAEILTLPLDVKGAQRIQLGLCILPKARNAAMQVKLSTEKHWRRVRPFRFLDDNATAIQDVCLGVFDIKPGAQLSVRTEPASYAALAYVHLKPGERSQEVRHKNNAGVVFDTNMTMSCYRIEQPDDLHTALAPYIESDFTHIFWGTGVGTYSPLYFSEALGYHGQEQKQFIWDHRERTAAVMRMFAAKGIDPLRHALEFARANGLQFWANHRISKNHEEDFRDDYAGGRFLLKHRDKRVLNRDGSPHEQVTMSFAYPEIREMAVRCVVEQAKYGVDGIYLDLMRKYPLVGWEPAAIESFKKKHGSEPNSSLSNEWTEHRCSFVTQFMRELRSALGSKLPVAVQVPGGWRFTQGIPSCQFEGFDVITWAREGLIDILAPSEWTALMYEHPCYDRISALLEGTNCKLWGAIGPQCRDALRSKPEQTKHGGEFADMDPWRYMLLAHDMYSQGADGIYIWEAHDMPSVLQRWEIIKNIGDRETLNRKFGSVLGKYDGSHRIQQEKLTP